MGSDLKSGNFAMSELERRRAAARTEAWAEGYIKGRAKSVLIVLQARSVPVSEDIRERVLACTDLDQFDVLLNRAITVGSAAELFDGS